MFAKLATLAALSLVAVGPAAAGEAVDMHKLVYFAGTISGAAKNCTRGHGVGFTYKLTPEGRGLVLRAVLESTKDPDLALSFQRGVDELDGASAYGCIRTFAPQYMTKE